MAGRRGARDAITRDQWAGRIAADASVPPPDGDARGAGTRDARGTGTRRADGPITVDRIVDAALGVVESVGFDDLTMRAVATELHTGPASLYAHVRSKAELGDLLIGRLCASIPIPEPDPARWREQYLAICVELRDRFLRYPGVARAALAVVPADLATLRVAEGMLGIALAGGASPRDAAWLTDASVLYLTAYCLEAGIAQRQSEDLGGAPVDRAEIAERLRMLPADRFPLTVRYASELTDGGGHERFDFALGMMLRGLTRSRSSDGSR